MDVNYFNFVRAISDEELEELADREDKLSQSLFRSKFLIEQIFLRKINRQRQEELKEKEQKEDV